MLDEEQHQQAAGEVRNSWQASRQRQTQCALAYWWKRRHSWVAVAESRRKPPMPYVRFFWLFGGSEVFFLTQQHQFCGLFTKTCVSNAARKGALNSS